MQTWYQGVDDLLPRYNEYTKKSIYTPKVILKIIGLTYMGWCTAFVTFTIIGQLFA